MEQVIEAIRKTPNRGQIHVFLGHPLSDTCDKTTVEPGNTFSPGVWTCGIAPWVEIAGQLYTPDLLPDAQIEWGFADRDGCPPVLESRWRAGSELLVTSRLTHLGGAGAEGVDFCETCLSATAPVDAVFHLVIKEVGPAGGKIEKFEWDAARSQLRINGLLTLVLERAPDECRIVAADEQNDSPLALLRFGLHLRDAETWRLAFKAEHGFGGRAFAAQLPPTGRHAGVSVKEGFERSAREWETALPARVFCPDVRVVRVWEQSAYHILANMECGVPRIGAVNYPGFWMRDGVLVLRAVDLIGRADLARIGNEYLAPLYFSGGFGAESDAPGEGIWALVSHAQMTGDSAFLADVFPHLEKRVEWLERMRTATAPIRYVGENRIPRYINAPGINLLCLPAQHGLIHGRMDWHSPDFFINCWAACGLRKAAEAAQILGRTALAGEWSGRAQQWELAIAEYLLPAYGNDRDPIITPHPTGVLSTHRTALRAKFDAWYRAHRLTPQGARKAESLWTYFEAAQIHNAMQLGLKDLGWTNLDGMLTDGQPWNVSAYVKGRPGGNEYLPFHNGEEGRGWLDPKNAAGGNMPHLWTAAELIMLIRNLFVREEAGRVVLGEWVPPSWLKPGARFGVAHMPTDFGPVSYSVSVDESGKPQIDYTGKAAYRVGFPS